MSMNSPLSIGNFDNGLMLLPENQTENQLVYNLYSHVWQQIESFTSGTIQIDLVKWTRGTLNYTLNYKQNR